MRLEAGRLARRLVQSASMVIMTAVAEETERRGQREDLRSKIIRKRKTEYSKLTLRLPV